MLFASAVPESVGVVSLVISSEDEEPVSVEMPVIVGFVGATESTFTLSEDEVSLTLPAMSVAFAVNA